MAEEPKKSMDQVIREDGRYPPDAYGFLHDALTKAVKETHGKEVAEPAQRHVSGKQLCLALRDAAIERWGMLTKTVLSRWNIYETADFGNMVYLLICNGFMRKTEEDSIDDFHDVFDFDDAFDEIDHFELTE